MSNGMVNPTLFPWRPVLVRGRNPMWYPARVRNRLGTCNAVHQAFTPVMLCADVACLAWARWMEDSRGFALARAKLLSLPETPVAKEAKETDRLRWKSPRLS